MAMTGRKVDPVQLSLRRLATLLLAVLVLFGGAGVWSAFGKERGSSASRAESQAALADLTRQQSQLEEDITDLQSDRGKEAALRQQYAVGKAGEHLLVIVDPATTTPSAATTTLLQQIKDALSWW
jgi:cell division protein FtsB